MVIEKHILNNANQITATARRPLQKFINCSSESYAILSDILNIIFHLRRTVCFVKFVHILRNWLFPDSCYCRRMVGLITQSSTLSPNSKAWNYLPFLGRSIKSSVRVPFSLVSVSLTLSFSLTPS